MIGLGLSKMGLVLQKRAWKCKLGLGLEVQIGIGPGGGWHGEHKALHQLAWARLLLKPNICHQWASPKAPSSA